jgi:hypothetical protein
MKCEEVQQRNKGKKSTQVSDDREHKGIQLAKIETKLGKCLKTAVKKLENYKQIPRLNP